MEYVPGIKINDIEAIERAGINRELLAQRSAESYLTQICRHGFFHCDPHPGNVACDNVEGGRLIYYDFGMMDELKDGVKKGLVDLIFGVYENDTKEVLAHSLTYTLTHPLTHLHTHSPTHSLTYSLTHSLS